MTTKLHENLDILVPMVHEVLISMMDLKVHGNSYKGNFNSNLLCTTQLLNTQ